MFYLGRTQKLKVVKRLEHGAYLSDEGMSNDESFCDVPENERVEQDTILLPRKEVGLLSLSVGDLVQAFIYKDSDDRPIATVHTPYISMGEIKRLEVKEVSGIGAFLDWGLVKDLFLPFREQTYRIRRGDKLLVSLYVDKSSRLCATMKVYPLLQNKSPYKKDDTVKGLCYEKIDDFGAFVAVDDKYSALIPKHRLFEGVVPGQEVTAHVARVLDDGRLELQLRDKGYQELEGDAEKVFQILTDAGGFLPYHDKTAPEIIIAKFGMSKNAYKKAIGHLMKTGKIFIYENGIESRIH